MVAGHSGKRSRSAPMTGAILTRLGLVPTTWTIRIPTSDGVDPAGELEVGRRQATRRVVGDRDGHLVPREAQVRVMPHPLGRRDQLVDEPDRVDEVVQLEGLDDRIALALPALELREAGID